MFEKPLVSIIIPTYNRAHLIGETLDSVLAQTYKNWECIVVDDGSTDGTDELLKNYGLKESRIKYHKRSDEHMPGGNGARNYGFKLSNGDLVQWFDSDDIMCANYLEERIEIFKNYPNTDVVFCAFTYFDENGLRKRIRNERFTGNIINDLIYKRVSFGPPSYLIQKKILRGTEFDETLYRAQDLDFFFKLFTSSKSIQIKHEETVLFKVRKHYDNISVVNDKLGARLNSRFIVNKRILDYFSLNQDAFAIESYKRECLNQLKKTLENKNYRIVIKNIINFPYLNLKQKVYLISCALSEFMFGRGSNQFKRIKL